MKKILPFICTMFISFSAWGVTCDAGYYLPDGTDECVICPAGKYSEAGASSCSNVSAGYFCSGGCTTATPTSDEDCLTGNTCGQCLTDSVTGREAYSEEGAASCSVCPEVTGDLAGRVPSYGGWWSDDIHNSIGGCIARFYDDDPDASYKTNCYYSIKDGAYGGPNSRCETRISYIEACTAGKYNTITSASEWNGSYASCRGADCMKGKVCTDTTAGYYSLEGEVNQTACPAGTYSAAGDASCSYASAGYYATGCTDGTACTGQSQCTGTMYCAAGVQYSCPTGYTENTTDGKSSVTQCQTTCPAGNYMASGTYTQLEYLESSGTQYINTGIKTSYGLVVTARFSTNVEKTILLGGRTNWFNGNGITWGYIDGTNAYNMYGGTNGSTALTKSVTDNQQHTIVLSPTGITLDGEAQAHNTFSDQVGSNDIYLFTWNNAGDADTRMWQGKVYGFSIADANGNMVRDMIPARRNSDSVLGMLDLASGQFFTNAGTGTFVAGPDVAQIGGTCSDTSTAGHYAAATTIGYGTPAPQTACPAGTYSAAVGASSASTCTACPAGEYSAAGASTCTACPAGTYSATGAAVCSNPAIGYYASGCTDGTACTGQSQCTGTTYCVNGMQYSCPTGYTANTTDGKSAISQCQATCPDGNYMANCTYTKLEYLSSTTAGQYIDTGITFEFTKDLRILSSFINPDTTQRHILVGTYKSSSTKNVLNVELKISGNFRVYTVADGSVKENSSANLPANTLISYDLSYSATNHKVSTSLQYGSTTTDVQVTTATSTSNTPSSAMRLFLDYRGSGIKQPVSIGETKIYKEGALVFDGVPARRNSDNELGFLDLVSGQFLTNAGTGTFVAGPDVAQIGGTCSASSAGYYATATTIGYGTPAPQTACPAGTFAPTGSAVCYPHRLHIGDDVVYVRSTKLTTPSLNIDIDRDGVADFFVNMTTTRTRMNKDSEHYFHAQWGNNDYYICDDTTCPQ